MGRTRSTSLARNLALAYALLIAYACLHPLSGWRMSGLPLFDYLLAPWPKYFILEDLLFNILGYLPFGFLAAAALPGTASAWRGVMQVTALVDSLWPFLALAYLSALGLWRGEHLAARPGKAVRNL